MKKPKGMRKKQLWGYVMMHNMTGYGLGIPGILLTKKRHGCGKRIYLTRERKKR